MSKYFLKLFSCMQGQYHNTSTDKSTFYVGYGLFSCAFDVVQTALFFPMFKQFLKIEMT